LAIVYKLFNLKIRFSWKLNNELKPCQNVQIPSVPSIYRSAESTPGTSGERKRCLASAEECAMPIWPVKKQVAIAGLSDTRQFAATEEGKERQQTLSFVRRRRGNKITVSLEKGMIKLEREKRTAGPKYLLANSIIESFADTREARPFPSRRGKY